MDTASIAPAGGASRRRAIEAQPSRLRVCIVLRLLCAPRLCVETQEINGPVRTASGRRPIPSPDSPRDSGAGDRRRRRPCCSGRSRCGARLSLDRRVAASKSATASNMPPVRMNSLTACRRMFASGVPALPFAVSDDVIVAPTILSPFAFTRDMSSFIPAMIASADAPELMSLMPSSSTTAETPDKPRRSRSSRCSADGPPGNGCGRRIAFGRQDPVSADACVDHRHTIPIRGVQPARQHVRPAIVAIQRRQRAVGDRIAERADHDRIGGRHHVDGVEEIPRCRRKRERGVIVFGRLGARSRAAEIRRLQRLGVPRHRAARPDDVKRDSELATFRQRAGRKLQLDRIAVSGSAGGNIDAPLPAEQHRPVRPVDDVPATRGNADVDLIERDGLRAERVREPDAKAIAPQVRLHDQSERLIDRALCRSRETRTTNQAAPTDCQTDTGRAPRRPRSPPISDRREAAGFAPTRWTRLRQSATGRRADVSETQFLHVSRIIEAASRSVHEACMPVSVVRLGGRDCRRLAFVRVCRGRAFRDADVQQRCAPCAPEAVSGVPSAELDRADVVPDLQGYASLRARHRKSRRQPNDAAVVCRPDGRPFQEHQAADRRRDRIAQQLGEEWRARRRSQRQARAGALRGGVDNREARHHRGVSEGNSAAGDRRHRPVEPRGPGALREGHVGEGR